MSNRCFRIVPEGTADVYAVGRNEFDSIGAAIDAMAGLRALGPDLDRVYDVVVDPGAGAAVQRCWDGSGFLVTSVLTDAEVADYKAWVRRLQSHCAPGEVITTTDLMRRTLVECVTTIVERMGPRGRLSFRDALDLAIVEAAKIHSDVPADSPCVVATAGVAVMVYRDELAWPPTLENVS